LYSSLFFRQIHAAHTESEAFVLVVSQFTLASYIGKGNRPSFSDAMVEGEARVVFDRFVKMLEEIYPHCKTGVFRAHMEVELVNDGPVTFIIERHPKE